MIKLETTESKDLDIIKRWIQADPYHRNDHRCTAEGLLTGNGLLTFSIQDDEGPLCFVRLDAEGEMLRLSTQFGPEEEVSKRRLVSGLLSIGIPAITEFGKQNGYKGIVFESRHESLIGFMSRQGFFKTAVEHDYALIFGEN